MRVSSSFSFFSSSSSSCSMLLLLLLSCLSCSFILPHVDAYRYELISSTIPKGSYYVVSSLTSPYLAPLAGTQTTQNLKSQISTTPDTDAIVTTTGMGWFAIASMDTATVGSYCVIRVLDAESRVLVQSGLSCTIAPTLTTARVQVEPGTSADNCGAAATNPCKTTALDILQIDSGAGTTSSLNIDPNTDTPAQASTSSSVPVGALIGGVVGGVVLIFLVAGAVMYYRARTAAKRTVAQVYYNSEPNVIVAMTSTGTSSSPAHAHAHAHARSQTTQLMDTYCVNPALDADQADVIKPAPYRGNNTITTPTHHNIYRPTLQLNSHATNTNVA